MNDSELERRLAELERAERRRRETVELIALLIITFVVGGCLGAAVMASIR